AAQATNFAGAERVAWLCYENGDYAAAKSWLRRAPAGSETALWLEGKLAAREGGCPRRKAPMPRPRESWKAGRKSKSKLPRSTPKRKARTASFKESAGSWQWERANSTPRWTPFCA